MELLLLCFKCYKALECYFGLFVIMISTAIKLTCLNIVIKFVGFILLTMLVGTAILEVLIMSSY